MVKDAGPLPVLVVRRGPLSMRALATLERDQRVELYVTDELDRGWQAFSKRIAGVIILTEDDPFGALSYAVTAGITAPIILAMSKRFSCDCKDLVAAGAADCVMMPITKSDVDRIVPVLMQHTSPARIDATLRLLLDPISRVARYRDKVVRLSLREFALLHCLSARGGQPVPAEDIVTYVWGDAGLSDGSRKLLDVYIFQLRKKLKNLGLHGAISTVRGFGYSLVAASGNGLGDN